MNHLEMIGDSQAMKSLSSLITRVAPTNATVLIQGESGTGKELIARAIHAHSRRSDRAFVPVNCAALQDSLLESVLFGHEKGSFTGASSLHRGKFELASGGTLFLDEIGEMNVTVQAKLLRALQERAVERVGGTAPIPVDIRVVAATNRDLEAAVAGGQFRADLHFRLNVIAIAPPPLRDRAEDIPELALHFARRHAAEVSRHVRGISEDALNLLKDYHWPGNVRELQNVIEHAVVLGASEDVIVEDLPIEFLRKVRRENDPGMVEAIEEFRRRYIRAAWIAADSNCTKAAELAQVSRSQFHRLVNQLGLRDLLPRRSG